MQNNKPSETCPDLNELIHDLLGLDPRFLTKMDPAKAFTAVGLHEFMRVTMERALSALWAPQGALFRLIPDSATETVRRLGWSDANAYNLSSIIAHALVRTPRRARGLPYIPVSEPHPDIVDLPWKVAAEERATLKQLVDIAVELFEEDIRAPGPGTLQSTSICVQIQGRLSLSPDTLSRPAYDDQDEAASATTQDPEGQAINGLASLVMSALRTYQEIVSQPEIDDTSIRLLIQNEKRAENAGRARYSNIANLLVAGLLSEAGRDLGFITPAS